MPEEVSVQESDEPTAMGVALGVKGLTSKEDKIALGVPFRFVIRGAGGANAKLTKKFDVYPRPFHVLDKIADVWIELLSSADAFGRGTDNSLEGFVSEVLAAKGQQRDTLFKIVQLMVFKPTGKAIDWAALDDDTLPGCPRRSYLLYNLTAPDVLELFDKFSKQNDWQTMLKKVMAVEAVGARMQRAMLSTLAASAAFSARSSEKQDGQMTT